MLQYMASAWWNGILLILAVRSFCSSNISDKKSKIRRKFHYLEKLNSKIVRKTYNLEKNELKRWSKFYYCALLKGVQYSFWFSHYNTILNISQVFPIFLKYPTFSIFCGQKSTFAKTIQIKVSVSTAFHNLPVYFHLYRILLLWCCGKICLRRSPKFSHLQ